MAPEPGACHALKRGELHDAIESEGHRFGEVIGEADLAARVPGCPLWDLRKLADHVGRLFSLYAHLILTTPEHPLSMREIERLTRRPPGADLAGWLAEGLGRLTTAIREVPAIRPHWPWPPDYPAGLWLTRVLTDLLVHRADAEIALGRAVHLDERLAVSAVDERFANTLVLQPARPRMADLRGEGQVLRFLAGPGRPAWTVELTPGGFTWSHEERTAPDVCVRSGAAELLLLLHQRLEPDHEAFTVSGDRALLEFWLKNSSL